MCENGIVGIGMDLCQIARIESAMQRARFTERLFTERERAYITGKGKQGAQSAAAMFAAKEAVMKALGTGVSGGVFFDQIEVTHNEQGAPGICLSGAALARMEAMGGRDVLLSLSHEGDMAAAFALIRT